MIIDNSIYVSLAYVIVPYIMDKFRLGRSYYGSIHDIVSKFLPMIVTILVYVKNKSLKEYLINYKFLFSFATMFLTGYAVLKSNKKKYITICIYNSEDQQHFKNYTLMNKQYWGRCKNISVGNINKIMAHRRSYINKDICNENKVNVYFDDPVLNIRGHYYYDEKEPIKINNDNIHNIHIKKNDDCDSDDRPLENKHTFIKLFIINTSNIDPEQIIKKLLSIGKNEQKKLFYKKKFVKSSIYSTIYSGPFEELSILEARYISTFFHDKRDQLWNTIKRNILEPEYYTSSGQIGRVSMLLYGPPGTGKSTLAYRTAMCLSRDIMSVDLRGMDKDEIYKIFYERSFYNKSVIVLEEFDISILELQRNENLLKQKEEKFQINLDMQLPIADYSKFRTRDLLELFQGTVPLESMIIFATTNKFDEIKSICPELFRPGRLTPVHFGYISIHTLQDISRFYFKQEIKKRLPDTIELPTSQIIELALEHKSDPDGFSKFESSLISLL